MKATIYRIYRNGRECATLNADWDAVFRVVEALAYADRGVSYAAKDDQGIVGCELRVPKTQPPKK